MTMQIGAAELSTLLTQRIDQLVRELLPFGQRMGADWRCDSLSGGKGTAFTVHLTGKNPGGWVDHRSGEFGDALDLVAACLTGGSTKEAYRWAHGWLGLGDLGPVAIRQAHLAAEKIQRDAVKDEQDGRKKALAMWLNAEPVTEGSPVLAYIRNRGIDVAPLGRFTRSIRFAPAHYCNEVQRKLPAMLAAFTDATGAHVATHQTWLTQDSEGRWVKARLDVAKKIRGAYAGAAIRLRKGDTGETLAKASPDETVLIGEGIETCLSVAVCCPEFRVLAAGSLSNMAAIWLPDQVRKVTLLADRDEHEAAKRGLDRAIDFHLSKGREVRVAKPPRGKDFNDAIQ
ncbi:toprim domain-containing protein [Asaia sp. HumB]|uniref:DUF7146 domain-containing protein n=1 Tax=Asaia sp. HumB TaxID=3035475 RepID=UPI00255369AD|nr:toprim domain-containing protein [Asaia sp. HumB]MDL2172031.1 toprim domain-containing protein [Asaia sp. HumB]